MTRFAFLKKYFLRFAATVALLGLLIYVLVHVFRSNEPPMITPAYLHTDYQIVGGEAYLFRDEQVLRTAEAGVINRFAENGEKIGKGGAVCEVWNGYGDDLRAAAQIELDSLNRMIAVLEDSRVSAGATLSKAELFRREAETVYAKLRALLARGETENLRALTDRMLTLLNRYRAIIGADGDVESALESIRADRDALLRGTPYTVYNTEGSGYFYDASQVDGSEELFTTAALNDLTVAGFDTLIHTERPNGEGFVVGKMAKGDRWYLALGIEATVTELFKEGTSYGFVFPDNGGRELDMTCTRILTDESEGAVVLFSTDVVPTDFAFLRMQRVEITVDSFVGYHVPDAAMRTLDGAEGVYIFEESTVRFRRVEVLYRGDGYCIVAQQGDRGDEYLSLNDMIITSGENLYEGRVYR